MDSVVDNGQREVLPLSLKAGFDGEKSLFDRVEVQGIGGEEYELAQRLVFDQRPDFLRMVDTTVVEYEYTARARVRIGEGNDKVSEELKESLGCDRARDDVVGQDAVDGEDRKDGIALTPDKVTVLNTTPSHGGPSFGSSRCAAITSGLVDEHQHVRMGDNVCDAVHICSPENFVTLLSFYRDTFLAEVETVEGTREGGS
jgi:hypothetical protein